MYTQRKKVTVSMLWKEVSFFLKRRMCTIIECVKCNFNDTKTTDVQRKMFILKDYFSCGPIKIEVMKNILYKEPFGGLWLTSRSRKCTKVDSTSCHKQHNYFVASNNQTSTCIKALMQVRVKIMIL